MMNNSLEYGLGFNSPTTPRAPKKDGFNYQFEYPKYKSIGRNYREMHNLEQYHSKA